MNPALAGAMPENASGFGDLEKIDCVYMNNEIRPLCHLFLQVNENIRVNRRIIWQDRLSIFLIVASMAKVTRLNG